MKRKMLAGLLLAAVLTAAVLSACASGPKDVKVTLSDYQIDTDQTSFEVGKTYRFVITNEGTVNHEFMVMAPMMGGMEMSMEEMDAMALGMVEADELTPGTTQTLEITFPDPVEAGTLEFACHEEGHYEQGMHLPISVRE